MPISVVTKFTDGCEREAATGKWRWRAPGCTTDHNVPAMVRQPEASFAATSSPIAIEATVATNPPKQETVSSDPVRPLRAITLTRPWAWTILSLPEGVAKRIENRGKRFLSLLSDEWIALHSGLDWDHDAQKYIEHIARRPIPKELPCGIVGLVHFSAVLEYSAFEALERRKTDPWFSGPWGHVIDRVIALPEPVSCRGNQVVPFAVNEKAAAKVWEQVAKLGGAK